MQESVANVVQRIITAWEEQGKRMCVGIGGGERRRVVRRAGALSKPHRVALRYELRVCEACDRALDLFLPRPSCLVHLSSSLVVFDSYFHSCMSLNRLDCKQQILPNSSSSTRFFRTLSNFDISDLLNDSLIIMVDDSQSPTREGWQ
ncbi:hypothetical protein L484_021975 [Morus notabilis]|uniref:Uncharacterized protein n=1 Tax=Morus notabilis TaxID=981085 RepID=W9R925_9ROSA|nr:hypothetical protein L484_021975 [Morus notabilis]